MIGLIGSSADCRSILGRTYKGVCETSFKETCGFAMPFIDEAIRPT